MKSMNRFNEKCIEEALLKIGKADKGISGIVFLLSKIGIVDFEGEGLTNVSALLQDQLNLLVETRGILEGNYEKPEKVNLNLSQAICAIEGLIIMLSHVGNIDFNGRDMVGISKLLEGQLDLLLEIRNLMEGSDDED